MTVFNTPIKRLALFFFFLLACVLGWFALLLFISGLNLSVLSEPEKIPLWVQATYIIGLYSALSLGLVYFQFKQNLSWHELGFKQVGWLSALSRGFWGGFVFLTLQYLTLFGLGAYGFSNQPKYSVMLILNLLIALAFAFIEEWFFRGWLLCQLSELYKPPSRGVLIQALFYAFIHRPFSLSFLTSPHFFSLVLVGLILGHLRLKANSLWLPMGLHCAWIYFSMGIRELSILTVQPGTEFWSGGLQPLEGWLCWVWLFVLLLFIQRSGDRKERNTLGSS